MLLQQFIAVACGLILGTITGLTPGLHINLVSVLLVALSGKLTGINPESIALTIISMAVTHTFLDTIPSIFLGVPDPEKVAVTLPTHRMVFNGEAHQAVMLTIFGSFISLLLCILLTPAFIIAFKTMQTLVSGYIGVILLILTLLLILQERKKTRAAAILLLSGLFGQIVLNMPNLREPLLPMLSGLFGISTLILGIESDSNIPEQRITGMDIKPLVKYKALASSVIAGAMGSFLPGMGPSQIAILGSKLFRGLGDKGYIILVGGLNTVNMTLSIAMLYAANKARNGAIVAASQLVPTIDFKLLLTLLSSCLIAAGISTILVITLSRKISEIICKVNYKRISIGLIIFILAIVAALSGWVGIIVLLTSTALGITCNYLEVGKNHLMGCLLVPVILFFLI